MNDIKWLKLDVNILNHNKIKMIRKYPDGDALFALWIGLICLAMKSDQPGFIYVCDSVPYSAEDLALLFDLEIKTVEMGLTLFEKFDMIQNIKGGIIEVLRFREYQNIEGIERKRELTRKRVNRYREKVKQLPVKRVTDALVTECNADRLEEIRRDKSRIELDKDINIYIDVLDYLNLKTGCKYSVKSKKNIQLIKARVQEGHTLEDFKSVIDKKCAQWAGGEWARYLRPETLFGTKFEGYLNEKKVYTKTQINMEEPAWIE